MDLHEYLEYVKNHLNDLGVQFKDQEEAMHFKELYRRPIEFIVRDIVSHGEFRNLPLEEHFNVYYINQANFLIVPENALRRFDDESSHAEEGYFISIRKIPRRGLNHAFKKDVRPIIDESIRQFKGRFIPYRFESFQNL